MKLSRRDFIKLNAVAAMAAAAGLAVLGANTVLAKAEDGGIRFLLQEDGVTPIHLETSGIQSGEALEIEP